MDVFALQLDFSGIIAFFAQPGSKIIWELFFIVGWVPFAWMLIFLILMFLEDYKEGKATKDWKYVLLAIDIPSENTQTPRAVEQLFANLSGAFSPPNIADKYHSGHKQRWFSFEIISIEGYIQFLVWTEESLRDLVEASVYAQYPEAEITEVEDYVPAVPQKYPNDEYEVWASDFVTSEDDAYPIRTYEQFEHGIDKFQILKDPMSAFVESFSRIGPGEQMWFQIIIKPISNSWKESAIKKVKELIGEKTKANTGPLDKLMYEMPGQLLEGIGDQVFNREAGLGADKGNERNDPNQLQYLTPGQKRVVESIEDKISKIGFKTKMRAVYLAKKEVFKPQRGVNSLIGAVSQFNSPSSNSISPAFVSAASYFFAKKKANQRKNMLMEAYRKRKAKVGANEFVLNIEELATVWHFPMSYVKTPLLQKSETKRAEPPSALPIEGIFADSPVDLAMQKDAERDKQSKQDDEYDVDAGDYPSNMQFG